MTQHFTLVIFILKTSLAKSLPLLPQQSLVALAPHHITSPLCHFLLLLVYLVNFQLGLGQIVCDRKPQTIVGYARYESISLFYANETQKQVLQGWCGSDAISRDPAFCCLVPPSSTQWLSFHGPSWLLKPKHLRRKRQKKRAPLSVQDIPKDCLEVSYIQLKEKMGILFLIRAALCSVENYFLLLRKGIWRITISVCHCQQCLLCTQGRAFQVEARTHTEARKSVHCVWNRMCGGRLGQKGRQGPC